MSSQSGASSPVPPVPPENVTISQFVLRLRDEEEILFTFLAVEILNLDELSEPTSHQIRLVSVATRW